MKSYKVIINNEEPKIKQKNLDYKLLCYLLNESKKKNASSSSDGTEEPWRYLYLNSINKAEIARKFGITWEGLYKKITLLKKHKLIIQTKDSDGSKIYILPQKWEYYVAVDYRTLLFLSRTTSSTVVKVYLTVLGYTLGAKNKKCTLTNEQFLERLGYSYNPGNRAMLNDCIRNLVNNGLINLDYLYEKDSNNRCKTKRAMTANISPKQLTSTQEAILQNRDIINKKISGGVKKTLADKLLDF